MDVHSVGFLENWRFGDFQFLKSNPNEPEQPIETSQLGRASNRKPPFLPTLDERQICRQGRFEPSEGEVARQGEPLRLSDAPPEQRPGTQGAPDIRHVINCRVRKRLRTASSMVRACGRRTQAAARPALLQQVVAVMPCVRGKGSAQTGGGVRASALRLARIAASAGSRMFRGAAFGNMALAAAGCASGIAGPG
jgi:hypothetical protein